LAHHDAEQRRGHVRADIEQACAVSHERRPLDLWPDHDPRTVDQAQHGYVECVAQLQESRTLVRAIRVDRAGQMIWVVRDDADRAAFDAHEGGNQPDAELWPDLE